MMQCQQTAAYLLNPDDLTNYTFPGKVHSSPETRV
jgi:hypothetical protein